MYYREMTKPDIDVTPISLTQYKDLNLDQPGLIGGSDYYLGYISGQGYYWLQFKIEATTNASSLRLSLHLNRLITGSVTSTSFPWRLLIADTNDAPTSDSVYTSLITQKPDNSAYMLWNATGLDLKKGKTYYLSVWAGSSTYPGGVMTAGTYGDAPIYTITLNPSI